MKPTPRQLKHFFEVPAGNLNRCLEPHSDVRKR